MHVGNKEEPYKITILKVRNTCKKYVIHTHNIKLIYMNILALRATVVKIVENA